MSASTLRVRGEWGAGFNVVTSVFRIPGLAQNEKQRNRRFVRRTGKRESPTGLRVLYMYDIYKTMARKDPLAGCVGFDWDDENVSKNWEVHHVTPEEAEDLFFHDPFVLRSDLAHSRFEKRYWAFGQTARGRKLFVAFTLRQKLIRVISVRDMSRREIEEYQRHEKSDSEI